MCCHPGGGGCCQPCCWSSTGLNVKHLVESLGSALSPVTIIHSHFNLIIKWQHTPNNPNYGITMKDKSSNIQNDAEANPMKQPGFLLLPFAAAALTHGSNCNTLRYSLQDESWAKTGFSDTNLNMDESFMEGFTMQLHWVWGMHEMLLNLMISYFSHFFSFHVIFIYLLLFFFICRHPCGIPHGTTPSSHKRHQQYVVWE